jgi:predicted transport protein
MRFDKLRDPECMCIDVAGKGRCCNGDVEAAFTSLKQLPYILGLVRQSLAMQLGEGSGR